MKKVILWLEWSNTKENNEVLKHYCIIIIISNVWKIRKYYTELRFNYIVKFKRKEAYNIIKRQLKIGLTGSMVDDFSVICFFQLHNVKQLHSWQGKQKQTKIKLRCLITTNWCLLSCILFSIQFNLEPDNNFRFLFSIIWAFHRKQIFCAKTFELMRKKVGYFIIVKIVVFSWWKLFGFNFKRTKSSVILLL